MKIYKIDITNDHFSLLACTEKGRAMQQIFNTRSLVKDWEKVDFEFKGFNRSGKAKPDIKLLTGGLAFRSELKEAIFPKPCSELEFLPIRASGEDWLVVNCLKTTDLYDQENSVLYSTDDGEVFMIIHVVVEDPTLEPCEVFVLKNSNRTTLLTLPSFVERIDRLGLKGINFKEIGVLKLGDPH